MGLVYCIHSILHIYVVFGCSVKCFWIGNAEMDIKTLRFTGAYFDRRMFRLPFGQLPTEYYEKECVGKGASTRILNTRRAMRALYYKGATIQSAAAVPFGIHPPLQRG